MENAIEQLSATDSEATFTLSGKHLLSLKHTGGTWTLSMVLPDAQEIDVAEFDKDAQHRLEVPRGTQLKLAGGTKGAKAWTASLEWSGTVQ